MEQNGKLTTEGQPWISDSRMSQWPTNLKSRRKNRSKKLNRVFQYELAPTVPKNDGKKGRRGREWRKGGIEGENKHI